MNILFISLGCDKNLVDSEVMLGILAKDGHQMVDDETMADVIIINTCCFIHDAKEESIQNILEMADLKKTGRLKALIVTGCLAQRYKEEIIQEIPEVDAVLGTTSYEEIAHVIDGVLSDSPMERGDVRLTMKDVDYLPVTDTHRMVTTGGHFAYLKIAEGCDKHCTYCIIPKVRGDFRSVPMEHLLEEAQNLVDGGVKELILVAQETTLYGTDIYGKTLGICGMGEIGLEVVKRMRGFGCKIIYSDIRRKLDWENDYQMEYVSMEDLLKRSDFISIHTSLNPHTRHMFNMDKFKQMKKDAIIINTSRGPVIDQEDLTKALQQGIIGGAGLDVAEPEPMKADNPLLKMPNVVILPHIASASIATRTRMGEIAAEVAVNGALGKRDFDPKWIVPNSF